MRIRLKHKLLFLVLLPHLAIIGLATEAIYERLTLRAALSALQPMTELATSASLVIHELQKERGQTVGAISSSYAPKNVDRLSKQRTLSDTALDNFQSVFATIDLETLPLRISEKVSETRDAFTEIGAHRSRVDGRNMAIGANVKFYTGIILNLIEIISLTAEQSPSQTITALLLPYLSLVEAKEHSGLERAIGAAVLNAAAKGEFDRARYESYLARLTGERLFLAQFQQFASEAQRTLFADTVSGSDVDQVMQWRMILAEIPNELETQGVTGSDWFAAATKRINLFKAVEDAIAEDIQTATAQQKEEATTAIYNILIVNSLVVLFFAAIGVSGALPIARRIGLFVDNIKALASGKDDIILIKDAKQDDIGDMNRALVEFQENIERSNQEREARVKADIEAAEQKSQALRSMADAVEGELTTTVSTISNEGKTLAGRAGDLSAISSDVSNGAQAVAAAAEEATANAATVAQLIDQVNAALDDVSDRVSASRRSADDASTAAEETGQVVSRLEGAAAEVGAVVELISDIAEQTNLLALNATIEAARAGEAGKGFAVVANEVKALATQTQNSASEITTQMSSMQSTTKEAVTAMSRIADAIQKITKESESIETAVKGQKDATNEIALNASQSSEGSREVSARIAEMSTNLSQVDEVSRDLASVSDSLRSDIDNLQSGIRKIVRTSTPEANQRAAERRKSSVPISSDQRKGTDRRQ